VRYGNVATSRGSVIPFFIDRIKAGKSIPVTAPHMTRFLLSLEDAVDLVEFAITNGKNGDVLIKKAPAATVQDVAEVLLKMFKSSSKIEIVGIRSGEKIHELLAHHMELETAEDMGGYYRLPSLYGFDYQRYFDYGDIGSSAQVKDYSSENTLRLSQKDLKEFLASLPYVQRELEK
jgi:UDP-glucose 4-epimerase